MMKGLSHCVLVGQPARGASGNPEPVDLPNVPGSSTSR